MNENKLIVPLIALFSSSSYRSGLLSELSNAAAESLTRSAAASLRSRSRFRALLLLNKLKQVGIDRVFLGLTHAMRETWIDL
jgi:hypothetical protein